MLIWVTNVKNPVFLWEWLGTISSLTTTNELVKLADVLTRAQEAHKEKSTGSIVGSGDLDERLLPINPKFDNYRPNHDPHKLCQNSHERIPEILQNLGKTGHAFFVFDEALHEDGDGNSGVKLSTIIEVAKNKTGHTITASDHNCLLSPIIKITESRIGHEYNGGPEHFLQVKIPMQAFGPGVDNT